MNKINFIPQTECVSQEDVPTGTFFIIKDETPQSLYMSIPSGKIDMETGKKRIYSTSSQACSFPLSSFPLLKCHPVKIELTLIPARTNSNTIEEIPIDDTMNSIIKVDKTISVWNNYTIHDDIKEGYFYSDGNHIIIITSAAVSLFGGYELGTGDHLEYSIDRIRGKFYKGEIKVFI